MCHIYKFPWNLYEKSSFFTKGFGFERVNKVSGLQRDAKCLKGWVDTDNIQRPQSRAVIGLLTGHNALRRHLYLLGLQDSPLCRKCGVMEETSAHILCECEGLASLRHVHLGSFFFEPKDIQSISLGAIWSFSNASGLPWLHMGHKGPVNRA